VDSIDFSTVRCACGFEEKPCGKEKNSIRRAQRCISCGDNNNEQKSKLAERIMLTCTICAPMNTHQPAPNCRQVVQRINNKKIKGRFSTKPKSNGYTDENNKKINK
jgi:hypothetical protein